MPDSTLSTLDLLVIDPSSHMTTLISQMLRHLKVRSVAEAHDTDAAARLLHTHRYGAIMVNDVLSPADGVTLVRTLRQAAEGLNRDTPVIMMSSSPDALDVASARDAGITEFLRKPFAAKHIETRLLSILAAPRPFVASGGYAGPDRRRRRSGYTGSNRRH